ncbi:DUF2947 family protein [Elizabethkingia anophelis]|uniref:DUF2947 family protein n=1 Tax=Elizabethkingia anophelis TaxID=1117645 RepID=UPI001C8725A5
MSDQIQTITNKNTIITTLYHVFLENICNFLELYDDCPILISHEKLECIYFTPLGNTFYSSYKI